MRGGNLQNAYSFVRYVSFYESSLFKQNAAEFANYSLSLEYVVYEFH